MSYSSHLYVSWRVVRKMASHPIMFTELITEYYNKKKVVKKTMQGATEYVPEGNQT